VTQEELDRLTPEERERLARAEQAALDMFNRRMREGRWYPRRHMRFAFFVIAAIFAVGFVVMLIGWLVSIVLR
jgi:hypothetical protein